MQNSIQSEFNQLFLKMEISDPKKIRSIKDAWLNDSDYRRLILSTLEDVFLTELSPMNGKVSHVSKIASTPREEPPAKLMQNGG
ncbi:MAG: hypothetical protein ACO3F3_09740, partial [Gemmataceae bacterium]